MSTLVVQAHPVEDSLNGAIYNAVVTRLKKSAQPVATVRIGDGDKLGSDVFESVKHLIAIYPTWYGSLPAQFLGEVGELLGPWVDGTESAVTSPVRSVQSLKVVTSHGSSKLLNTLQGQPGMHLWKRIVLPLCAPGATFGWKALYKVDRNSDATRTAFIDQAATFAAPDVAHQS